MITVHIENGIVQRVTGKAPGEEVLVIEDGSGTRVLRAQREGMIEQYVNQLRQGREATAAMKICASASFARLRLDDLIASNPDYPTAAAALDALIEDLQVARSEALGVTMPGSFVQLVAAE